MPLVKDPVVGLVIAAVLIFGVPMVAGQMTAALAVLLGVGAAGWFLKAAWDDWRD